MVDAAVGRRARGSLESEVMGLLRVRSRPLTAVDVQP
jgi:hypothetical protein